MTELLAEARRTVGPAFLLMLDVQYAFQDADACLKAIRDWVDFDLYFLETPLPSDDLDGYARLAKEQPIPIAAGEWLTTRFEFVELIERGKVRVLQPDIGRVGGLTEAKRVCDLGASRGLRIVPHLWKTGISIAAATHLAVATPHCPLIEYLPTDLCESSLRKQLVGGVPEMENGRIAPPERPGLGIELHRDALECFKEAAERLYPSSGFARPILRS